MMLLSVAGETGFKSSSAVLLSRTLCISEQIISMLHFVSTTIHSAVNSLQSDQSISQDQPKDAVIDVEQVEMSEFSVSLKKRLSRTLIPLAQLTFHEASESVIELRDKDNELVMSIRSGDSDGMDGSAGGNRRASVDQNNNQLEVKPDAAIIHQLSFIDETDSIMFRAAITDEAIRVTCGTEDIGTVERQPFAKGMTGKDSKGNVIFYAYVEEKLFKKTIEPEEILVFAGEEPIGKFARKEDGGKLCLTFSEELNFSTKAMLLTAAYVMRSAYFSHKAVVPLENNNCCLDKIGKVVLASVAALMVLATVTVVSWDA